ncbi:MAG: hypothetical protein H7Y09_09710 [Chitinophagaceae bacterium]|nr:hypothetical protein [Anaerolineae bacterium]
MKRFAVFCVLALTACATKYQDMGMAGGVAAQQMTKDTYRIVSRGNGYTAPTVVQDYTMLKAAETTKRHGGTHFIVVDASDASRTDQLVLPGSATSTLIGNQVHTTYSPATAHAIFKPGQDAYIRVVTVAAGATPPAGAVSADEIISFVGPRVERG